MTFDRALETEILSSLQVARYKLSKEIFQDSFKHYLNFYLLEMLQKYNQTKDNGSHASFKKFFSFISILDKNDYLRNQILVNVA